MTEKNPFAYSIGSRVREKPFLKMLSPKTGDRILDLGCGLGYFTDMLSSNGTVCTGIDLDEECISYCKKNMRGKYEIGNVNSQSLKEERNSSRLNSML
jgi:2-polyprenyl-3-methyl-5-hydroxy-6-metoxy-1,4-benzoquinol methylase